MKRVVCIDLVLRAARERCGPTTDDNGRYAFAIMPLAIYGNVPGQEIEYPMAVVILGGLVIPPCSNLLSFQPSIYASAPEPRTHRKSGGDARSGIDPPREVRNAFVGGSLMRGHCFTSPSVGRLHSPVWAARKFERVSVYLEQTVEDEILKSPSMPLVAGWISRSEGR